MKTVAGPLWEHSSSDGGTTQYRYWTVENGRLRQHCGRVPPLRGPTGPRTGPHWYCLGKLNGPVVLRIALDEVRLLGRGALEGPLLEEPLHEGSHVETDLAPQ